MQPRRLRRTASQFPRRVDYDDEGDPYPKKRQCRGEDLRGHPDIAFVARSLSLDVCRQGSHHVIVRNVDGDESFLMLGRRSLIIFGWFSWHVWVSNPDFTYTCVANPHDEDLET